jgi:sulfur-oxidizing protein SoxB
LPRKPTSVSPRPKGSSIGAGNFNGTYDQLVVEALMAEKNAQIAFSPGFRWGTSLLPGQAITMGELLDQTAITYPFVTVNELTARRSNRSWRTSPTISSIRTVLPAGRRHGARRRHAYAIDPRAAQGKRITRMELAGKPSKPARPTRSPAGPR